jgi:hypothetical protein
MRRSLRRSVVTGRDRLAAVVAVSSQVLSEPKRPQLQQLVCPRKRLLDRATSGIRAPTRSIHKLVEAVFMNEDIFELICSKLGALSCLHLGAICSAFDKSAWRNVLRHLSILHGSSERFENEARRFAAQLARQFVTMPTRVVFVRRVAFSMGLNANGKGLVETLQMLAQTYPELSAFHTLLVK